MLPGTHKLATNCWLVVGPHALLVEAFVCRKPDENAEELYRFLLRRNSRLYAVSFSIDKAGDVYLVGRLPLHAVTPDEVDRILGAVLQYADETLRHPARDRLRQLDPARVGVAAEERRVPTANLQAFARFADPDRA